MMYYGRNAGSSECLIQPIFQSGQLDRRVEKVFCAFQNLQAAAEPADKSFHSLPSISTSGERKKARFSPASG